MVAAVKLVAAQRSIHALQAAHTAAAVDNVQSLWNTAFPPLPAAHHRNLFVVNSVACAIILSIKFAM